MITLLLSVCLLGQRSITTPISFANGVRASVVVQPDDKAGTIAYLYMRDRAPKPITYCDTWSEAQWFSRRDGSVVLLIQDGRFHSAFTVTSSGKIYPHDEPWYSDSWIVSVGEGRATVAYRVYANSEPARNAGVKQPCKSEFATIGFVWAPKRLKWVPRILGYE